MNREAPGSQDTNDTASSEKIAKGAGVTFLGKVVSTGLKYLTDLTFAWLLGAELFGLYTLGIVIYRLGELFSRLGLETGAVRYVSIHYGAGDNPRLKGTLLQAIGFAVLNGCFVGGLLFLSADSIAQAIFNKPELASALRLFAIALPFGAGTIVGAFASTGFQIVKYRTYVWELLLPFSNLLLAVILCVLGFGLWGAAIAWLIATIISLLASLYFIVKLFPGILDRTVKPVFEGKQLLSFSIPLAFGSFAWLVLLWTDVLMLGYFRPAAEVGIYRAASQTSLLMNIIAGSLITAFSPMIADLYSRGERKEVEKIFQTSSRWSLALTLPLFLIMVVAGDDILRIFGAEFAAGWIPLMILCTGHLVRAGAGGMAIQMLSMTGHQYLKLYTDLGLAALNIGLNILLIPKWGALGAAIATGISITLVNLLRAALMTRVLKMGLQIYNLTYLKVLIAGVSAILVGFLIRVSWLGSAHFFVTALLISAIIVATYAGLLKVMGLEDSDRLVLAKVFKKFKSKKAKSQ